MNVTGVDAYAPAEIATRIEAVGVAKAKHPLLKLFMLSVLAGVFIGFGAAFYTVVVTNDGVGYGLSRLLGGMAFSLGLVLVVVGGAELFTGNNLIVMAWADKRISTAALLRNWGVSYVGNAIGGLALAFAVYWSGVLDLGASDATAIRLTEAKLALPPVEAFLRGALCNALVCLAVWLSFAARSVTDKILAIVFPITAFVALGFEHSIANFYLIPVGLLAGAEGGVLSAAANLIPVTLGNIVGGAGGVAGVYWVIYGRT
ncbi:formate/nitrite transporter family protein [Marinicaulis aureus]|uniref:Formate/nitrite transporter family protein n=1 Tax=Hyphococcus aureus TaxID=2666033 RepID=A0ABW1KXS6_9PROT